VRRYSILQALPLSFFSRDLYRDVAASWRGIGLAYLALVVALLALFVVVRMQVALGRWADGPARGFADQVPTMVIRHRVVEIDRPMPFVMVDRKSGEEVVVVDTTGQVTSLDGLKARVLVTADHIVLRKSVAETRVFSLAGVDNLTLTPARARRWLALFSTWASPCVAPFVFGGMFLFRMIQVLVFALVGLLVARLARVRLDWLQIMRVTAVALTPALLLDPLIDLAGIRLPGGGWLWTAIVLAYVAWGVLANRSTPEASATVV
jgi:uncharacterized protein DUF1189